MIMGMIEKLEMFIALAREQHFGRAAQACGVTQPTLSAAIKQLEAQLGVQLVWRGSRFRGLTPEGARVLDWARRIVGDTRAMKEEMRAAKQGLSGKLRIAVIPTALTAVTALTGDLARRHAGLDFTILSRSSADILDLLDNLQIDAGVTYLDNDPVGRVTTVPLYDEHYCLIAHRDMLGTVPDTISWARAADLPLALLTPDMQNRRIISRSMAKAGKTIEAKLESNSVISLVSHVSAGAWATILPPRMAELFLFNNDLCAVPLVQPTVAHVVGLIAPFREPHTPVTMALLTAARALSTKDF